MRLDVINDGLSGAVRLEEFCAHHGYTSGGEYNITVLKQHFRQ